MTTENKEEVIAKGKLEYTEFKKYTALNHKRKLLFYFVSLFLLGTSLLFYVLYDSEDFIYVFLLSLVLALIITVIMTGLFFFLLRVLSLKDYKSDHMLKKETFYTISKKGISQKTGKSHFLVEWTNIFSIREHKGLFLIYLNKQTALIIPKRYFSSEREIRLFKDIINNNLDSKKIS